MASTLPLMPKATAVWLIDNTALTFDQIAGFCGLHPLEVNGIADGDVAAGVRGIDPITQHQLTREEIAKAENNPAYKMALLKPKTLVAERKKGPRYTPVSKRQNRPDAILWLVRNHPEISDAQIGRLLGTTKTTITAVRDRTHWNSNNLEAQDPIGLGLCSQIDLDMAVKKGAAKRAKMGLDQPVAEEGDTLRPAEETVRPTNDADVFADTPAAPSEADKPAVDPTKVFANFSEND